MRPSGRPFGWSKTAKLVGIFPEGRINTTEQLLLPGLAGAAMIAVKAKAPLVPCYLHGSPYDGTTLGCLFMPASVRLEIGAPIDVATHSDRTPRQTVDDLMAQFIAEIERLAERSQASRPHCRNC